MRKSPNFKLSKKWILNKNKLYTHQQMNNHRYLNSTLAELAKLQIILAKKGGPNEDGQLFEEILALQDEILKGFGLPTTSENENIIWFSQPPTDEELNERANQLQKTATEYLLSDAKPDLQILIEGLEMDQDPFMVLPQLKIATHSYTFFVYNNILLKRKDTVENVLHQLRLVNRPKILGALGTLEQNNVENSIEVIKYLKDNGVKYLAEFLSESTKKSKMSQSNHLIEFLNELSDKASFNSNEERFNSMTNRLMNYLCLAVGKHTYRITECEIYYMDIEHQDGYVHCGEEQMTVGKLYYNKAGGLDITFGNANIPSFGGILIRGVRNLNTNEYINQITKIVSEVFNSLGNIITEENGIYLREVKPNQIEVETPIQSTRIGLRRQEDDADNFFEKPYRYIVELTPSHKFKEKEKIVKQLLSENKISSDDAKNILGYILK